MENRKLIVNFKKLSFEVPDILEDSIKKIVKEFIFCSGFKKTETEKQNREISQIKISEEYKNLINMFYKLPSEEDKTFSIEQLTATEIKTFLEKRSGKNLSVWKVGQELKELGFRQHIKKICGKTYRLYKVVPLTEEKTA
jgi:hypothetical protein